MEELKENTPRQRKGEQPKRGTSSSRVWKGEKKLVGFFRGGKSLKKIARGEDEE